eukprot:scaffold18998_cov125-Isochrysis_galbana.AAC.6
MLMGTVCTCQASKGTEQREGLGGVRAPFALPSTNSSRLPAKAKASFSFSIHSTQSSPNSNPTECALRARATYETT